MNVSVITPTFGRPHLMESLHRVWKHQTLEDRELLVCDDSPTPSPFMSALRDPAVRYFHLPGRMTIGEKRNFLVREARGDVIAHFDDDDFYAAEYLRTMVRHLEGRDLVKLSRWFAYDARSRGLYYSDTEVLDAMHYRIARGENPGMIDGRQIGPRKDEWVQKQLWGYGFSYVYRKPLPPAVRFDPTMNKGEDYDFVARAQSAGLRLGAVPDEQGLALHVIHESNTSCAFPNYRLPEFLLGSFLGRAAEEHVRVIPRPE